MATQLVPLTSFYSMVRTHVPDAPVTLLGQMLRLSAIEFSELTRAWRQVKTYNITKVGQTLVAPPFTSIFEIELAEFNGNPLTALQYSDVEQSGLNDLLGQPCYITQSSPDSVMVLPFEEGTLTLSLFLRPRNEEEYTLADDGMPVNINDQVPDYYLTQFGETIVAGALYRLFIMPKKDWTDEKRAAFYLERFNNKTDRAFQGSLKGQQDAVVRTKSYFM